MQIRCQLVKLLFLVLLNLLVSSSSATTTTQTYVIPIAPAQGTGLNVPITVQEALYPGAPTTGINRVQDTVTVGIPLPIGSGITSESQLGLSGASVGQFRTLGRWPTGEIVWVLVDTEANVQAGGTAVFSLVNGSGNFGGANLAQDNGSNITINTGAAQFTLRKKYFNLFDQVVVNGKVLVAPGTSQGLVLMGPAAGQTACGVCTNAYSSANDPNSTAVVEENGPVRAAIKVDGSHVDASGHVYMHYTVRMHFFRGKKFAKVEVILRNADESSTSGDFASAFKGFTSYEARVTPVLGSGSHYTIGTDTTPVAGNFSSNEDAYIYQAYSNNGEVIDWNAEPCPPNYPQISQRCVVSYIARTQVSTGVYTYAQDGYQALHGGSLLASGDHTKYPQGWADVSDASGAGIEVGVYQFSAYWPKSLQLKNGGSDVRVGIWPDQSLFTTGGGQPYYQAWPTYSIHDLFFEFHDTALNSPANEFLAFQHHLIARAPISQYNLAGVFPIPLVDKDKEDAYYKSLSLPTGLNDSPLKIWRYYGWANPGAGNQHEMRWAYLRNFLERGLPGRYLFAANFYRMVTEHSLPRSDGFAWRNHPISELDYLGFPTVLLPANYKMAHREFVDGQHAHWFGIIDYYFTSGDETIKDQLVDGAKDALLNPNTVTNKGRMWDTRDTGERAMDNAHLYWLLSALGDPDASLIPPIVDTFLRAQVFTNVPTGGFSSTVQGTDYKRGVQWGCCNNDTEPPNFSGPALGAFHEAILEEGLYDLAWAMPNWANRQKALDFAYGIAQAMMQEQWATTQGQTPSWQNTGFRYLEFPNVSNAGLKYYITPGNGQTTWFNFLMPALYAGDMSYQQDFEWFLKRIYADNGNFAERDSHMVQAMVDKVINPPSKVLKTIPVQVTSNGNGSYTLTVTVPQGAVSYRIKYNTTNVVDGLGFDIGAYTFAVDPTQNSPWFSSTEYTNVPAPGVPGTQQQIPVTGLDPTQTFHFAVKAWVKQ